MYELFKFIIIIIIIMFYFVLRLRLSWTSALVLVPGYNWQKTLQVYLARA